jgi:prephenate dehydratase
MFAEQTRSNAQFKASVIFATRNVPGALYDCLGVFHKRGLNLSRLESRPVPGEPWRYMFYADIAANKDIEEQLDAIIRELGEKAGDIRLLGIYQDREC